MWRSVSMANLIRQFSHLGPIRAQTVLHIHNQTTVRPTGVDISEPTSKLQVRKKVPKYKKVNILVKILNNLDDNKESVYHALDGWLAWQRDFPLGTLRQAMIGLEKENHWRRIIHVIKWMLSKGQGTTLGTYGQLVRALDRDHRAEEAHEVWVRKLGVDLHSVPWQQCHQIIAIYNKNNMMERTVKLFEELEAYDRKPKDKKIVKKVGEAYESLGLIEEKERVLEKYKRLFIDEKRARSSIKKSKR